MGPGHSVALTTDEFVIVCGGHPYLTPLRPLSTLPLVYVEVLTMLVGRATEYGRAHVGHAETFQQVDGSLCALGNSSGDKIDPGTPSL